MRIGPYPLHQSTGAPYPRFPVEFRGFPELHAPFLGERRTRGPFQSCVQEIGVTCPILADMGRRGPRRPCRVPHIRTGSHERVAQVSLLSRRLAAGKRRWKEHAFGLWPLHQSPGAPYLPGFGRCGIPLLSPRNSHKNTDLFLRKPGCSSGAAAVKNKQLMPVAGRSLIVYRTPWKMISAGAASRQHPRAGQVPAVFRTKRERRTVLPLSGVTPDPRLKIS
jgi:hypothetical protein